jgi:hypothetical protein
MLKSEQFILRLLALEMILCICCVQKESENEFDAHLSHCPNYMKAAVALKVVYSHLIHITYLAHGLKIVFPKRS